MHHVAKLMLYKNHLIIIDKNALLTSYYPIVEQRYYIHTVDSANHAFQQLNAIDVDIIIVVEPEVTKHTVDLALEIKQSIVTKDLPVLVLASQPSIYEHATYLHYCGISFLDLHAVALSLLDKIDELSARYHLAREHQNKVRLHNQSYKTAIQQRIATVCSAKKECSTQQKFSVLLFHLDLNKIRTTTSFRSQINKNYLDSIIYHCITQFINEDEDYLVSAEPGRFYVVTDKVNSINVESIAERVNDLLYYIAKSDTTRIHLAEYALHVGIVTASCLDGSSYRTVITTCEAALAQAKDSEILFYKI